MVFYLLLPVLLKYNCLSFILKGARSAEFRGVGKLTGAGGIRTRDFEVQMRGPYPIGYQRSYDNAQYNGISTSQ